MLRNFDAANKTIDRAIAIGSDRAGTLWEIKSELAFIEKGDFSVSEKAFEAVKSVPWPTRKAQDRRLARGRLYLGTQVQRRIAEAESLPDDQLAGFPGGLYSKYYSHRLCTKGASGRTRRASGFP